jgi:hypothetical protein
MRETNSFFSIGYKFVYIEESIYCWMVARYKAKLYVESYTLYLSVMSR